MRKKTLEKKTLEKELHTYGKQIKEIQAPHREQQLITLLELEQNKESKSTFVEFVRGQLHLGRRFSLPWEMLWLAVFLLLMTQAKLFQEMDHVLLTVSMFAPALMVILAADISRVLNRSMLEIEATTKYSISQILLFRLLMHSLVQLGMVFVGAAICSHRLGESLGKLLLYGYTPLIVSGAVLLLCISRCSGNTILYAGGAIVTLLITLLFFFSRPGVCREIGFHLFAPEHIGLWEAVLIVGLIVYAIELLKIRKGVHVNGIGTMRSIEML